MNKFDKSGALSREFLINRGRCCSNKCKNCPYFPRYLRNSRELFKAPDKIECRTSCSFDKMQDGQCMCYLNDKL